MPTAYVLINSDLGTDESIISKIKEILKDEKDIEFTPQGVYGIYDIVLKISSDNTDILRNIITYKIRKINNVQSTLTMMVVEEQEKSDLNPLLYLSTANHVVKKCLQKLPKILNSRPYSKKTH